MNYTQTLSYLESLIEFGVKTGLEHTAALAAMMGDPQNGFPSVLIAGTNGKGSTSAFLSTILKKAGYRTGLYTSPHLVDVEERIAVDGCPVARDAFAESMSRVRQTAEKAVSEGVVEEAPTYFESLTLACFDHFNRTGIDIGVLEVGLGGRMDCTNIVRPVLTAVTNVGLDHEKYLGHGLASIAREKGGIFRRGVPALTAAERPLVLEVLGREALRAGTVLSPQTGRIETGDSSWRLECGEGTLELPYPAIPGAHQIANASLAVRCCLTLRTLGWPVGDDAIRAGIAEARWPGRLERVAERPDTYFDGAHNPDGCEVLARFVRGLRHPRKGLVFTAMKDKPLNAMAARLFSEFDAVWATSVPMPRCSSPDEIRGCAGGREVELDPDPVSALNRARAWAGEGGLVVVAGSLYLVGYLEAALRNLSRKSWGSGL